MIELGVNIDHVATVRQARKTDEPDPIWAAAEAELGGADGITFHLREDRRHIVDRDAKLLRETVACKLNMEMASNAAIVRLACELRPDQATLVPERRQELTTEGGLDVVRYRRRLGPVVNRLRSAGIIVCGFIEPIPEQIQTAARLGMAGVELWTGEYAHAKSDRRCRNALKRLEEAIRVGLDEGLKVHGGHGLTYRNIARVASLEGFSEFNIGHSIVARAIFVGMRRAVEQMKALVDRYAPKEEQR